MASGLGLAYVAVALALRFTVAGDLMASWVAPVGFALAVLETTNIGLEQFVGLPSPANAVVPASMMALLVLFAATSAVVGSARHGPARGVASALLVLGLGMLLACAAVFAYGSSITPANPRAFWTLMCRNATMHLTLAPLLALLVGSLAVAITNGIGRRAWLVSLAAVPLFATGVVLLVHAASLPRAARPDYVMPGMAVSALALICLPCFLGRPSRDSAP